MRRFMYTLATLFAMTMTTLNLVAQPEPPCPSAIFISPYCGNCMNAPGVQISVKVYDAQDEYSLKQTAWRMVARTVHADQLQFDPPNTGFPSYPASQYMFSATGGQPFASGIAILKPNADINNHTLFTPGLKTLVCGVGDTWTGNPECNPSSISAENTSTTNDVYVYWDGLWPFSGLMLEFATKNADPCVTASTPGTEGYFFTLNDGTVVPNGVTFPFSDPANVPFGIRGGSWIKVGSITVTY